MSTLLDKLTLVVGSFSMTVLVSAQVPFSLDTTFRAQLASSISGGGPGINSIIPLEDGKVIISGTFRFPNDPIPPLDSRHGALLNPDGSVDPSYPPYPAMGGKMTRWGDRFYVGVGQTVRRRHISGALDTEFINMDLGPYFSSLFYGDYHVFPDGSLVMGGKHILSDSIRGFEGGYNFIWFTNSGYLDTTKVHRQGNGTVNTICRLPDGKFVVSCGLCTLQEGQPIDMKVFRLHADGALDTSFQSPIDWGDARTITALDDGRLLVSGLFKASSFSSDSLHFVRLMPDGSIDPTFNNELEVYRPYGYGQFTTLGHTRLPDGRIVLHSFFSLVDEQVRNGIAILDQDGNLLDDAFTGDGCGEHIYMNYVYQGTSGIAIAPDGMLYIYGSYSGYDDDTEQFLISRLYPDDFTTDNSHEPIDMSTVSIYPNPANDQVIIGSSLFNGKPLRVDFHDVIGRQVKSVIPSNDEIISTSDLTNGTYLVTVRSEDRTHSHHSRLVIDR